MFNQIGSLFSLLGNAQSIAGRMQEGTAKLKAERVQGSAGGGMVEVEANGLGEILDVRIESVLFEPENRGMLGSLVVTAVNQAVAKGKQRHVEMMQSLTSEMNIPGLGEAISQATGVPPTTDSPTEKK